MVDESKDKEVGAKSLTISGISLDRCIDSDFVDKLNKEFGDVTNIVLAFSTEALNKDNLVLLINNVDNDSESIIINTEIENNLNRVANVLKSL